MSDRSKFLLVEDVYKSYGNKVILDNIDLQVDQGALVTVVGPSGCGKSTLLRLILGQEMSTAGEIYIDQKPVGFADETRGIVYQKYSLFPNLNVMDNVLKGFRLGRHASQWSKRKAELRDEAMSYLTSAGLEHAAHKYPHELSGGMQQRVAVLQALIMKPKILLMDEPFGALDPGTREDLQLFLLEKQKEHNMTIFFVTHDLEEAVFLGTRLICLSQFYRDDRGGKPGDNCHGAKIVVDMCIDHLSVENRDRLCEKETADFGQMIQEIRHQGFNPRNLQHVSEFQLTHRNAFQTLTDDELNT